MNIPIERLEIAAKRFFADSKFVEKYRGDILDAMERDRSLERTGILESTRMVWVFVRRIQHKMDDRKQLMPYMKWILIMYMKRKIYFEDVGIIWGALEKYDKLKKKNILNDKEKNIFNLDPPGLHEIVSKYDLVINRLGKKEIKWLARKKHATIIHQDSQMTLVMPLTFEGAKALSLKNGWCTAREEGWFDDYTGRGDLYILIDDGKPLYQFFQLEDGDAPSNHFFKEVSNRFNRRLDIEGIKSLSNKYPGLKKVFDAIEFNTQSDGVIHDTLEYMALNTRADEHDDVVDYFKYFTNLLDQEKWMKLLDDINQQDSDMSYFLVTSLTVDNIKYVLKNYQNHGIRQIHISMHEDDIIDLLYDMKDEPGDLVLMGTRLHYEVDREIIWQWSGSSSKIIWEKHNARG